METKVEHTDVVTAFEAHRSSAPQAAAVCFEQRASSYAWIGARADALAARLTAAGVRPGSLVGVCLERGPDLVAALLGVMKAGAAYVPIDPAFPADRVQLMLEDSRAPALVTSRAHRHLADRAGIDAVVLDDDAQPLETESGSGSGWAWASPSVEAVEPGALAYVIYTSGSTGRPKGVMVEHRGLMNLVASAGDQLEAGPATRLLAVTTVSFDIAALELFVPLACGGTIVLASAADARDGRRLVELLGGPLGVPLGVPPGEPLGVPPLGGPRVSVLQATPVTWRMLLDAGWEGDPGLIGLVGGEALPRDLADSLVPRLGQLWNMYGPTETTIWSTRHRVALGADAVPIGTAIENTDVHVVGADGAAVADGEIGELWLGGVGVARGYWQRPALTGERFVPDGFGTDPGARLYRTGDLCRKHPGGVLQFCGRIDHQVKVRGYRIEVGDIEVAVAAHHRVAECVVGTRGEDQDKILVAYITAAAGASAGAAAGAAVGAAAGVAELRDWVSQRLPWYMIPHTFQLVEQMPLTPNRKVDRKALAALELTAVAGQDGGGAPRDDLELLVAQAFGEVLDLDLADIAVGDDFLSLGGHSVQAFAVARRLGELVGREVDAGVLFERPVVADLAAFLRDAGGIASGLTAVELQPAGDEPPLVCVCGVAIYHPLAAAIGAPLPVRALFVDTDLEVFRGDGEAPSVDGLIDGYLEALRAVQPRGPYRLCGVSLGGAVALELARRLGAAGETVDLVVMLDTVLADSVRVSPVRWVVRQAARVAAAPVRLARRLGRRSRSSGDAALPVDARTLRIEERGRQAMRSYRPDPFDGRVVLFRAAARERAWHCDYDETLGWGALVADLEIHDVPGDHLGILRPPQVERVAEVVRALLLVEARD